MDSWTARIAAHYTGAFERASAALGDDDAAADAVRHALRYGRELGLTFDAAVDRAVRLHTVTAPHLARRDG